MAKSCKTGREKTAHWPDQRRLVSAAVGILLAVALFVALSPPPAGAEGGIEGTVLNKTGGDSPVKGQEVELTAVRADGAVESRLLTRTDDMGRFSFANLTTTSLVTYTASTKFQGTEYRTTIIPSEGIVKDRKAELIVFDSTTEGNLQLDLSHFIVEVDPETADLTVLEIAIVSNPDDKTLVTAPGDRAGRTLWFPLSKGALRPAVTEGLDPANLTISDEELTYDGPVFPGKRQVVYKYTLSVPGTDFTISKALAYPSRKINILMTDVGQTLIAPKLTGQQTMNISDRNYLFLTGESFEAGDNIEISIRNFPIANHTGQGLGPLKEVKWAALAIIVIVGLLIASWLPRFRGARSVHHHQSRQA